MEDGPLLQVGSFEGLGERVQDGPVLLQRRPPEGPGSFGEDRRVFPLEIAGIVQEEGYFWREFR